LLSPFTDPLQDTKRFEFAPQLAGAFKANCLHARACGGGRVFRAVIDEQNALRGLAQDVERVAIDDGLRLAQTEVAGTERNVDVLAQTELRKTVLVWLPRFVVQHAKLPPTRCGQLL